MHGRASPTVVVFAEKGDEKVLGVHALEGLILELDPSTGELKKSEASLGRSVERRIVEEILEICGARTPINHQKRIPIKTRTRK